jgi:hypothetical protein
MLWHLLHLKVLMLLAFPIYILLFLLFYEDVREEKINEREA